MPAPSTFEFSSPLLATADEESIRRDGYWVPSREDLTFSAKSWSKQLRFRSITYVKPLTRMGQQFETPPPFPKGVELAVVPSQPIGEQTPSPLVVTSQWVRYIPVYETRHLVHLEGTFADYLSKFGSKSRNTLRRKVSHFRTLSGGEIDWRIFQRPEEMPEFHDIAVDISSQLSSAERIFSSAPAYREELVRRAELGQCRGYVMYHERNPIAYVYCRPQLENLIYSHLAHRPEYNRHSAGTVLLYLILESLFEEKAFEYLDFGGSEFWYKSFFGNYSANCARVLYFRPGLSRLSVALAHHALTSSLRAGVALKRRFGREDAAAE